MQGFKKVLVALLVVATILGTIGPVFAAPADVAGTKYEDAAVRLMALGIFKGDDKGNFNPDMPINRAEATAIVIRALGLEKSADLMKGVTKFADVNADAGLQWATGAINIAVSQGIINGYPDGRFGGRDNVTYAQLAKMILYALNYGVTVEGGIWPTAVLAKADDLDILDGLSVVADAPILRGDAAKMLDNALDVNSLKQTGYGDLKQYEETGETMLEKLGLDEIEGRVVEIPEVASGLDDDEVTIEVTKVNDVEQNAKNETYTQIEGVDVQSLLGLEVKAWVNDDDEVIFVEKKTSDNDIYTDTIKEVSGKDKVTLDVLDDKVTFDEDAVVYVNNDRVDVDDLDDDWVGYYGRFVEDSNKIVFAYLFDFTEGDAQEKGAVVLSVDGEEITYFVEDEDEVILDLQDADAYHVYNAALEKISLEDVEADDVLFWWEADDEYYIVVSNAKAEGEVSAIKDTKITIDGKSYTMETNDYNYATYSLDDDGEVKEYNNDADTLEDVDGEEVVALLDLKGHVRHLRAGTGTSSGTQYGIVVGAPSDDKVKIFTAAGEEVTYGIEDRGDYGAFEDLKFYPDYDKGLSYALLAYKVNADGEVVETDDENEIGIGYHVKVEYTVSGDVYSPHVTLSSAANQYKGELQKNDDEEYVTLQNVTGRFYVDEDTVIMRALDGKELDPEVISWDDFKDLDIDPTKDNSYAVVFGEKGKTADLIVFVDYDFQGYGADDYFGVVLDDPYRSGGKWKVDVNVFGSGKQTYVAGSSKPSCKEGDVIVFKLDAKGEIDLEDVNPATGTKVEDGYVTVGSETYKIDRSAVIYQLDDGDIDRTLSISALNGKENVTVAIDNGVVKAVTWEKTGVSGGGGDEKGTEYMGTVVGVAGTPVSTVRIQIGSVTKTYSLAESSIVVEDKGALDVGAKVNFELIEGTSTIGYIEVVEAAPAP
jgi:hypothetical protein